MNDAGRMRTVPRGALIVVYAAALLAAASATIAQVLQARAETETDLLAEADNDNFGWSVANAGDVNGDGFPDPIVGAIYNDSAAKDAGKAYVFLGGPFVQTTPFVTMTGMGANDQFGVSVAGAGDVNHDGFDDVIVGARLNSLNGNAAGATFIFLGGRSMSSVPHLILLGEARDDWFGNAVSGAGDVNGDGYADVIVGAPYNDRSGSAAGAAFVFFGGIDMNASPDVILTGELHDDHFGWSVAGAGDVDGDGFDDVLVGARLHCVDSTLCAGAAYARGRAYVFRGGPSMDPDPDLVFDGDAANDWFGNTVSGIGDVNGDGRADIAVGAIYADPTVGGVVLSAAGTTSIYLGGSPLDPARDALIPGEQANAQSGWAIAAAGDTDGDGRGDLWTTAHFFADGTIGGAGKAYLFSGGVRIGPLPRATAIGRAPDAQLGQSIAGGDVAGFGPPGEGIVGEVYNPTAGFGGGAALVLSPFCVGVGLTPGSLAWDACAPFDSFNLYRGSVTDDLRAGRYGVCLQSGLTGASVPTDPSPPLIGDAFFYLLTGRTKDLEGALGFDSSGRLRRNGSPCP